MLGEWWSIWGEGVIRLVAYAVAGFALDQVIHLWLESKARLGGSALLRTVSQGVRWLPTSLGFVAGTWVGVGSIPLDGRASYYAHFVPQVALAVVVTAFLARVLGRVVRTVTARDDVPLPAGSIFVNLIRATIWILGVLWVLSTLGVSVAPLVTALGVTGLAVGLALQPTLENLFSGVQLVTSGQIRPGDYIRIDTGEEGVVLDVTWRNTLVRQVGNDVALVPNSVMARATVTNFSTGDTEFSLTIPVSFASAGDPDLAERIALEVAREVIAEVPEAVQDAEPTVRFAELTPPAAVLNVNIRCRSYQDRIPVRHEFIRRLATRFAAEGVAAPPVPLQPAPRR